MRRTLITILCASLLFPFAAQAQMLHTYTATSEAGEWQSIAQTGTLLTSVTGDYGQQTVALPFDFMFGLSDYPAGTNIMVRADGFVKLCGGSNSGGSHDAIDYWNSQATSIISPFMLFDGQMPAGSSGCWWQLMEDYSGNQMLVIEWQHVQHYPIHSISATEASQDNFNYQLRLHSNGDISAVYGAMHNGVTTDTLFNFFLVDCATTWQREYYPGYFQTEIDHVALRGTWDSVIVSLERPAYYSANNWIVSPSNNLAGVPDSGTVITWHRPLPPCPRPTAIAVGDISHNTVFLSWTPNDVVGSIVRIQYDTANFTPGTPGHNLLLYGGDTAHVSGLTPNHQHWLYIRSDCGADSSDWLGVQFTTPCTPLSHDELPLVEDLEDRPENDPTLWDGCWKAQYNVTVKDMSALEGRSNMALRVNNSGWFHLPPVDSIRTTVLRFNGHGPFGGSSFNIATLQVGVMADPFDINTLEVLQTFTLNHNSWQEYLVPMVTYTGSGNTVAFKFTSSTQLFIDDIELVAFDGCLPVESVIVSDVDQHTAQVGWDVYTPADSYRVVWYPEGQEVLADSLTTTEYSAPLADLTANTDYIVEVYALCGDSAISSAVNALFHTRCAIPLPLDADFDALSELPDCWGATSMSTSHSSGSYTPAVPEVVDDSGNNVVKFSSQYNNVYNYERGILLLPFVDTVVNRLHLSFDYRVERFPLLMSLMVGAIPGDDNIDDFIPISVIHPVDTLWHTYSVETATIPFAEGRLVIMQHSTASHEYVPGYWRDLGYVDNVHIETLPDCNRPAAVRVSQITSTSALVQWQENNDVGTYEVDCNGIAHIVADDTTFLLTGLTPSNGYTVGVRRLCTSGWTNYQTASFITACEPIATLPFEEDFEMWSEGEISNCWLRHYGGLQGSAVEAVSTTFIPTSVGNRLLHMKATNFTTDQQAYDAIAVLPEVGLPLDGLAIGFNVGAFNSNPGNILLELGVMADGGDSTTFLTLDTVPLTSEWEYYEHSFAPTDNGRLALRMHVDSYNGQVYIDDLGIFTSAGCSRPSALTVDTVTQHTVTVTVTDTNATGNYRLYWICSNSSTIDSMDIASTSATITGLYSGQYYTIYAATLCDNSLSHIVGTECHTDCDTLLRAEFPYSENFNSGHLSNCWSTLPESTTDVRIDTLHHGASGYSLNLSSNNNSLSYALLPAVDTLAGVDITFWTNTSHSPWGDCRLDVGVMANPQDSTTFSLVESIMPNEGWEQHSLSIGGQSIYGHHIAFRLVPADTTITAWATMNIDDVTLSISLSCVRPDSVVVDSVDGTTAHLTIADHNANRHYRAIVSSVYGNTTMYIDYTPEQENFGFSLTNLVPATEYTVQVSSVCFDGDITFATSTSFVTGCAPMPLPYQQGFENESSYAPARCWQGMGTVRPTSTAHSGAKTLYAYTTDDTAACILTTPELAFGTDSVRVTFSIATNHSYTDSAYHSHQLVTGIQVLADSLVLHETVLPASSEWQYVSFYTAPLPYGTRLTLRATRDSTVNSSLIINLDDLTVRHFTSLPSCNAVDSLTVTETGYTAATIAWLPQGNEQLWEVHLLGGGINTLFTVDTTVVHLDSLTNSTTYSVEVRPLCNDTLTGPWSEPLLFSTRACSPAVGITVTDVTATTATVEWSSDGNRWQLSYGPAGMPQGSGTTIVVDTTAATLTGLQPYTNYDLYIRTFCDEEQTSTWSDRTTFTTDQVGIADSGHSPAAVSICPNPARTAVTIAGGPAGERRITIADQSGRTVMQTVADGDTTLDISHLPVGVYFIRLESTDSQSTAKLVIL